jgi:ribonuclease Y
VSNIFEVSLVGLLGLVFGLLGGFLVTWLTLSRKSTSGYNRAKTQAESLIEAAKRQSDLDRRKAEVEAKENADRLKREIEEEIREKQNLLANQEKRLNHREETLDKRADLIDRQDAAAS